MILQLFSHNSAKIQVPAVIKLKIKQRTCEVNAAGENSSFIFTVCVKSVPCYHFKLAYVVLQMAVKEFFEPTFRN